MVTYTRLNLKLFRLVNKKKIPQIQLFIAYFALFNKLPKYEEHSDFFKLSGVIEKKLVSNFVSMNATTDRRTVRWICPDSRILYEKLVRRLLRKLVLIKRFQTVASVGNG